MIFQVIGRDGTDPDALNRRMAAREAHLALGDTSHASGEHLMGVALLNDRGEMIGSSLIVNYPSRAALDKWLEREPYVVGNVWETIEIFECRVGPSFQDVLHVERKQVTSSPKPALSQNGLRP